MHSVCVYVCVHMYCVIICVLSRFHTGHRGFATLFTPAPYPVVLADAAASTGFSSP